VFEAPNETFDFERAELALGQRQRHHSTKRPLWGGKPAPSSPVITFEEFDCLSENPGHAQKSVRLVWLQSPFHLSSVERPDPDLSELSDGLRREYEISSQTLQHTEGQSFLYLFKQFVGVHHLHAQKYDVEVIAAALSRSKLFPKGFNIRRRVLNSCFFCTRHKQIPFPAVVAIWHNRISQMAVGQL